MKKIQVTITDPCGFHARPAGKLVRLVKGMDSKVTLSLRDGREVSAARLIAVMSLGIRCGEEITLRVEGEQEQRDAAALRAFFEEMS